MEDTGIKNLKRIFDNNPSDEMTLDEVYKAVGFDLTQTKTNRMWIGNRLIAFKKYDLARPIYAKINNSQVLEKIGLTDKGKEAIRSGHIKQSIPTVEKSTPITETNGHSLTNNKAKISLEDVIKGITRFKQENPGFEITFDVKLKNG